MLRCCQDPLDRQDPLVLQEQKERKGTKEIKVPLVPLVHQDCQVNLESMVPLASLEEREMPVILVSLEHLGRRVM